MKQCCERSAGLAAKFQIDCREKKAEGEKDVGWRGPGKTGGELGYGD